MYKLIEEAKSSYGEQYCECNIYTLSSMLPLPDEAFDTNGTYKIKGKWI